MPLAWTASPARPKFRNPIVHFRLNVMGRFFAQDKGLEKSQLDTVWWIAVIELADSTTAPGKITIEKLQELAKDNGLSEHLYVPKEYTQIQREDPEKTYATIIAQRPYLNAANVEGSGEQDLGVESMLLGSSLDDESLDFSDSADLIPPPNIHVPEGSVVTATIDNGIAIGHDLFRTTNSGAVPDTSRVHFFWNMDGVAPPTGSPPATFGRKWTKSEIDTLIANNLHAGLLDEPSFYRDLGMIEWARNRFAPCAQRVSHGTHVMGLFTGFDPKKDIGGKRPIIAVQLPTPDVRNPSGGDLVHPLELALDYIRKSHARFRIQGTAKKPPLVINFSFGNFAGPHDGTSEIERLIDHAMSEPEPAPIFPKTAVLPAGNGNVARCHARIRLTDANPARAVNWRIQPGDRSHSMVQFWTRKGTIPDKAVTLTVVAPGAVNTVTLDCTPGADDQELKLDGEVVATLSYRPPDATTDRGEFTLLAVPSDHLGETAPYAPPGLWQVSLAKGVVVNQFLVKAWVMRDETLPGFPEYGRQPYFDMPGHQRFKSPLTKVSPFEESANGEVLSYDPTDAGPVRRAGTLSGFACGEKPAVIAGFVRSTRDMANYSASGPTNNPDRKGPDAAAVSDDTVVLAGVLSAGSASGSRVAMRGTSVATPQVARWVADRMAAGKLATRHAVRVQSAIQDPPPPPGGKKKPPSRRAGGGRMSLRNQFGKLRWPGQ